jgi:hypothetical protein
MMMQDFELLSIVFSSEFPSRNSTPAIDLINLEAVAVRERSSHGRHG